MRIFTLALTLVCLVAGKTVAQDTTPKSKAKTQSSENVSLEDLLRKHDSQLNRLQTADVSWSVAYQNAGGETTTEKLRTTAAPNFQATTKWLPSGQPMYCWWDGERFGRIIGFSPHAASNDQTAMRARAVLYHANLPSQLLFDWRTLRSYRLFANDPDLSIRDLCEQSPTKPKITHKGDLIRLEIGHPGVEPRESQGLAGVPRGTRVQVDLDPQHGYLIKRHETIFKIGEAEDDVTQILEVLEYEELTDGLFVPSNVKYSLTPVKGDWEMKQDIQFAFANVNEPINIERLQFSTNMIVTEFRQYGDTEPLGYYVISKDLNMGPRYSNESIARAVQRHRLGVIDDATLKSHLTILRAAPDVGTSAPPIIGLGLGSGDNEKVKFDGQVTAIEFWSTTCGPCQGAMAKFDELAVDTKKKWPGKVQFVSVSLDEDVESVRQRMKDRGWSNTHSLVDSPLEDNSTPSATYPFALAKKYVVTAIPTCLIVNQKGQIVYRGNLFDDQPGVEIERLLGGEEG